MSTTLLTGARIVDGSGAPARPGQLLIDGDRIAAVLGPAEPVAAERVLDVAGKVVAPGFIDVHSHVDFLLPMAQNRDLLAPLLEQGITTVVAGNCGISPAPLGDHAPSLVDRVASIAIEEPLDYRWQSMASYLDALEETPLPLNVAQLVGHTSLRDAFGDRARGALGPEALTRCVRQTRLALDEGACGLSFGLGYDPGMFTPLEELKAFAAAAAASGKLVTSHIKAYSILSPCYPATYLRPHNLRALAEMLEVAHHAACRLQLSHFMVVGRRTWPTLERLLAMLDAAKARDLDCMIDAFPYPCGNSTVNAVLPYWFLRDLPRNYHRRSTRLLLRAELELGFRMVGFGYADFQLMNPGVPGWEDLAGLDLETTARRWRISPFDALLRLSEESRGAATVLFHGYSGDGNTSGPLDTVLARPDCLIETDAVLRRGGYPNPAARGTFPRVLGHFARDRGLFSLEDAVHRMTGASAARFGLAGRGLLAPGAAADLVVFDPDTIADAPLPRAGAVADAGPVSRAGAVADAEPVPRAGAVADAGPVPRAGAVADAEPIPRGGAVADAGDADSSLRPRGIERVFLRGVEVVAGGRAVGPLEGGQVLRH